MTSIAKHQERRLFLSLDCKESPLSLFSLLASEDWARVDSGLMDEEGKCQPKAHASSDGQGAQRSEADGNP